MRCIFKFALLVAALLSTRVFADGFVKLAAIYLSSKTDTGSTTSDTNRTLIDLNAAYVWPKGTALGLLYGQEKIKSGASSTSRTSYGPSVGWITRKESGAYVMATYLIKSELEEYSGDGYQADLGYKFSIRKMALAMQVSYKQFNYKELSGTKLANPTKETKIDPYFALMIEF